MVDAIRRFLARPNDDAGKTFAVAVAVAIASALTVSTASVLLEPFQAANIAAEQEARMEAMLDALPGMRALMLETGVDRLETRMVELSTGEFVPGADPADYDFAAAIGAEETSADIPEEDDIAGLRRVPLAAPVHILQKDGEAMLVVLPVRGTGYQSTIRAMLALESDLNTIAGLTVLEQGETPGLGARILEPDWQAQWAGRTLGEEPGRVLLTVTRGGATELWEIDGITGATRTGTGIQNMIRFWTGEHGYGPFLERLREEGL